MTDGKLKEDLSEALKALSLAYKAMNYLGDILNECDMAMPEDVDETAESFDIVRSVLEKHEIIQTEV